MCTVAPRDEHPNYGLSTKSFFICCLNLKYAEKDRTRAAGNARGQLWIASREYFWAALSVREYNSCQMKSFNGIINLLLNDFGIWNLMYCVFVR